MKFRPGDRVAILENNDKIPVGATGTISYYDSLKYTNPNGEELRYLNIEWDEPRNPCRGFRHEVFVPAPRYCVEDPRDYLNAVTGEIK